MRAAVLAVLIVVVLAGCAALGAALSTSAALQQAGYQNVGVNIETGPGQGSGTVQVSYSRGPSGAEQADALHAEHIVWDSLHYHFALLVIVKVSGGCAGPVCASKSSTIAEATYTDLADRFGPRPRGLDTASAGSAGGLPGWAIAVAVAIAVAFMAGAAVVLVMIVRHGSSRRAVPSQGPTRQAR
jgi:hypothetical protein